MQPEQSLNQNPVDQAPQLQPQAPPVPQTPQIPQASPTTPVPANNLTANGQTTPTPSNVMPQNFNNLEPHNPEKERKQAFWLSLGSIIVLIIGFLIGFAALFGAMLGIYGARKAKLIGYNSAFIMGMTGAILNIIFYILIVLSQ
ncbi:hypothetical protein KDA11_02110 [Candidatus Saccharibacteria bacterium]|nr:hypothetical protein [Candidatus Saccharibacteria bacterium]